MLKISSIGAKEAYFYTLCEKSINEVLWHIQRAFLLIEIYPTNFSGIWWVS